MSESETLTILRQMKKALPAERVKLRGQLLEKMNPALRKWFDSVETKITDRVQDNLKFYWSLGKEAKAVHEAENEYGAHAIQICAGCFQEDASVLYKAMKFNSDFSEDELTHLLSLRMKGTGRPVMWSHVVVLAQVSNKSKRNQYLHKLVANNWSAEELHRVIKTEMGANPAGRAGSGRKLTVPGTIDKMLHHMDKNLGPVAKKFVTVYNSEADGLLRLVQKTDPTQYTTGMLAELEKQLLVVQSIKENAAIQEKQIILAKKKITQALSRQAKDDGEAEAAEMNGGGKKPRKKKAEADAGVEELVPAAVE